MKNGGTGGPRALRAFGKACRVNERVDCKSLMVYSLGNLDKGNPVLQARIIRLYLHVASVLRHSTVSEVGSPTVDHGKVGTGRQRSNVPNFVRCQGDSTVG